MAHMGVNMFIDLDALKDQWRQHYRRICAYTTPLLENAVIFDTQEISLENITLVPLLRLTEMMAWSGRKRMS